MIERTLVLLKPDAVKRGIMGEILTRFEKAGLKVVGAKFAQADDKIARKHYLEEDIVTRHGEHVYKMLMEYLKIGPVMAICLEGVSAVGIVRKLCGTTESAQAAAGTIRGDYSHVGFLHANEKNMPVCNAVHASANPKEAEYEISVWFDKSELIDYKLCAEDLVL